MVSLTTVIRTMIFCTVASSHLKAHLNIKPLLPGFQMGSDFQSLLKLKIEYRAPNPIYIPEFSPDQKHLSHMPDFVMSKNK